MTGIRDHELARGVGRAFGGALLFALPLMMTMELWRLAHTVERYRLALLVVTTVALVIGLSRYFGAGPGGVGVGGYLADAGVALLVAAVATALVMGVLGVVDPIRGWEDALSVTAIETLPAAVGASYARSQLGTGSRRRSPGRYGHEVFLMVAGAVVFAANIAPTEEVVLLAAKMSTVGTGLLVVLSLVVMHGFVYTVGFRGQERSTGFVGSFLTLTVVGYAAAFLVSAYVLWTFGRFDGTGAAVVVGQTVVLGFPASVGAAAARLIL
ncbi:putative integral membrane protein TIGR02587 [Blastococcus sp. DSM 46786]|uniref:TIGR02587 family membrane protein n=1 Tax=Blastococcus sp. DSM 46786 TaxID=1798227 RepID=UPI0008BC1406|nr:TIGR02587 family membrane protein [Blastococcus sp. DSM 46786]SEL98020.1 putative integral membrane protein TIGR02587 [Blastococcus sp. DSM 46786]